MSVRNRFRNKYVTFVSFGCGLLLFTYFIILKNYSPGPTAVAAGTNPDIFYLTLPPGNLALQHPSKAPPPQDDGGGRAPQQVKPGAWTGLLSSLRFLHKPQHPAPIGNDVDTTHTLDKKSDDSLQVNLPDDHKSAATKLPRKYKWRVLCWVLTNPPNLASRTIYVKRTWGPRCDTTLYMSTHTDPNFPTIGLMDNEADSVVVTSRHPNHRVGSGHDPSLKRANSSQPSPPNQSHKNDTNKPGSKSGGKGGPKGGVVESKQLNSEKARRAWTYIYEHYRDQYDFFYKTDDDTYVIVENLRDYLESKDPHQPEFYGHRFILRGKNITYMSGGSGFILTRRALELLVTVAFDKYPTCIPKGAGEDWKTARCLQLAGCRAVDTRDSLGRERFLVFPPKSHIAGTYPAWYYKYDVDGSTKGLGCCAYYPISFHYIRGNELLMIDYFLYRMRVLGDNRFIDSYIPGLSKDILTSH